MRDGQIGEVKIAYDENGIAYMLEATENEARHILDLLQAELEGRLIVPPVKVGQTVYFPWDSASNRFIDMGAVFSIGVDEGNTMWVSVRYESGLKYYHTSCQIGKTVFLTKEEAEAALERKDDEV